MDKTSQHKRIYLDYAASTPIDSAVLEVLVSTQATCFANASGIHQEGMHAKQILDQSRITLSKSIEAHSDEIIFTSGGTESDNFALWGVYYGFKKMYPDSTPHIVVSAIEHPAIFELVSTMAERGLINVSLAPVFESGIIDIDELKKIVRPETILVSIIHANNEVGTIQPIKEIAKLIRHHKKHREEDTIYKNYPYFHTDACQSFIYEKISVEQLGVDLLTINSSKMYGPKGVGALFVKRGTSIEPLIVGGSQERNLRAGTENIPLIGAFGKAVEINENIKEKESARLRELRDYFIEQLVQNFEIKLHGSKSERLPNNINVSFIGYQSEQIVIYLDAQGIAVSEKSACKADSGEVSHVLKAMYNAPPETGGTTNPNLDHGSVRFSLGRQTTKEDLDTVVKKLKDIFKLLTKIV